MAENRRKAAKKPSTRKVADKKPAGKGSRPAKKAAIKKKRKAASNKRTKDKKESFAQFDAELAAFKKKGSKK